MDMTDHQHGQESHNTKAIEMYVSILDLKIKSNSGPVDENEIPIYFLSNDSNCGGLINLMSDRNFNLF
jgi:hypothetical protein